MKVWFPRNHFRTGWLAMSIGLCTLVTLIVSNTRQQQAQGSMSLVAAPVRLRGGAIELWSGDAVPL